MQALLGDLGEVLPYSSKANGRAPTPGWYLRITESDFAATLGNLPEIWVARDGSLFAGIDIVHAAATIERIHALAENKQRP